MEIFKQDKILTDNVLKIIRKILLGVCWILLAFSIPAIILWPLVLINVDTNNELIFELVLLAIFLFPITTILAMVFSKKSLLWFLLPLIPLAIFIISSNVGNKLQIYNQIQNQPQPLSTQGLPPPATDVPVVLPPDPGEAGKATLEGIDSNHDGVRDDLEREIVYMYPQNEEVRRVLRAMVKKMQDIITTTGDHEHFKKLMISYFTFQNCYDYLIIKVKILSGVDNLTYLSNMIKNTPERISMFYKNEKKASPYSSEINLENTCEKVKGQY